MFDAFDTVKSVPFFSGNLFRQRGKNHRTRRTRARVWDVRREKGRDTHGDDRVETEEKKTWTNWRRSSR